MRSGIEQKIKFSIKDFFSKWDQIHRKLQIWSHLLKKSLIENFIFCAVWDYIGLSYFSKLFALKLELQVPFLDYALKLDVFCYYWKTKPIFDEYNGRSNHYRSPLVIWQIRIISRWKFFKNIFLLIHDLQKIMHDPPHFI